MWPTTEKSNGDEKACKVMQVKNETQTGLAAEIKIVFRFSPARSEEHTSELQSRSDLVCRLLLEKKKKKKYDHGSDLRLHDPTGEPHRPQIQNRMLTQLLPRTCARLHHHAQDLTDIGERSGAGDPIML